MNCLEMKADVKQFYKKGVVQEKSIPKFVLTIFFITEIFTYQPKNQ
jgi:hypothetical protein